MNVYKKLAGARVLLQKSPIKKSGKNPHLKFDYMELEDFLPTINTINEQIGLTPVFSINETGATLRIYDHDSDGVIEFTSPVAHAKLQGNASPIQELGSQHTYMRRYMYLLAYEICENDVLDKQVGDQQPKQEQPKPQVITPEQALALITLVAEVGSDLVKVLDYYKIDSLENMTVDIYDKATKTLNIKKKQIKEIEKIQPDTGDMFDGHIPGA